MWVRLIPDDKDNVGRNLVWCLWYFFSIKMEVNIYECMDTLFIAHYHSLKCFFLTWSPSLWKVILVPDFQPGFTFIVKTWRLFSFSDLIIQDTIHEQLPFPPFLRFHLPRQLFARFSSSSLLLCRCRPSWWWCWIMSALLCRVFMLFESTWHRGRVQQEDLAVFDLALTQHWMTVT